MLAIDEDITAFKAAVHHKMLRIRSDLVFEERLRFVRTPRMSKCCVAEEIISMNKFVNTWVDTSGFTYGIDVDRIQLDQRFQTN
jgi:hypothetical protein